MELHGRRSRGEPVDAATFAGAVEASTRHVIGRQLAAGIDVGNDGEQARESFITYVRERLSGFCAAAEGVSHFLYLAHRAGQGGQVSQLELEAQGELDKYLSVVLLLWATGRRGASRCGWASRSSSHVASRPSPTPIPCRRPDWP